MDTLTNAMLLFGTLVAVVYTYFMRCVRPYPPGPFGVPVLGYIPFFGKSFPRSLALLSKKYGNVVSVNLGLRTFVVLNDWKAIKEALVKQGNVFSGRPGLPDGHLLKNNGLLMLDGPVVKEQRRFSFQVLRNLVVKGLSLETIITREVEELTQYLRSNDGKAVNVANLFLVPVNNLILNIFAGQRVDRADAASVQFLRSCIDEHNLDYDVSLSGIMNTIKKDLDRKRHPLGQRLFGYCIDMFDSHQSISAENKEHDFIHLYLNEIVRRTNRNGTDTAPYTKSHLVATLLEIMVAGVGTTDSTLRWIMLYVTLYQDVQKKIQDELDRVIPVDSILPQKSKSLAPYTQATLLEVQRLSTAVPLAIPHRTTADTILLGHRIPKDTTVFANLHAAHHDVHYWGDPEVFRPERFLDVDGQLIKHECLAPFSIGPRVCIGESLAKLNIFLMITCVLRRFSFSFVPGQPIPNTEPYRDSIFEEPVPYSLVVKSRN